MDLHEDSEFDNPRIMNSLNSAPRNGILQGTTGRASTTRNETLRPSASSAALRLVLEFVFCPNEGFLYVKVF